MAHTNQSPVARGERGLERPHKARAIDDAERVKVAAIPQRKRLVSAAADDTGSAPPSNDAALKLLRWMPLMVPLLAALMCAMTALIWVTSL